MATPHLFGHVEWRVSLVGRLLTAHIWLEVIMDKAAIFAEATRRNALRRANGLPLLDVRAEYDHAVAVAAQRDYQALCDEHADEREVIRQEVLTELRARHGEEFGYTMGGRWAVGEMTRKRFAARMAWTYGMVAPEDPARNKVIYGEAKGRDLTTKPR